MLIKVYNVRHSTSLLNYHYREHWWPVLYTIITVNVGNTEGKILIVKTIGEKASTVIWTEKRRPIK